MQTQIMAIQKLFAMSESSGSHSEQASWFSHVKFYNSGLQALRRHVNFVYTWYKPLTNLRANHVKTFCHQMMQTWDEGHELGANYIQTWYHSWGQR